MEKTNSIDAGIAVKAGPVAVSNLPEFVRTFGMQPLPETFRLPKTGGDSWFGFSRSFYYRGEQLGYWKLIRIRERGKLRGVTLVPYDAVAAFVRKQMEQS